jgi:hypothetical protein
MLLEKNHITTILHKDWTKRILNEFPEIDSSKSSAYLSIMAYIDNSPQKYYSRESFSKYLKFLNDLKNDNQNLLFEILRDAESSLSLANRTLIEINQKSINDIDLPSDRSELINFIDKEIHYNLLKLYESSFFHFIYLIAKCSRIKRNAGLDNLNLHQSVQELKSGDFDFIGGIYFNTIRNGIAHGKVIFTDSRNIYVDKNNKKEVYTRGIITLFDRTLDITNGFCLAFKHFCITNSEFLGRNNIAIPQSFLLEELQFQSDAPAWKIINCLESITMHDKKQLIVYIKNDYWDFNKVQWYCFTTAYWAERLTKTYDRIFFQLNSTHSFNGWAAFDGKKLKELREQNETDMVAYAGTLEDKLIFFKPKIKFP